MMAGFNDWLDVTDPKLLAETIAERFRLSHNELQKAQEALAPAFALGLQRAMASPAAWGDLSRAFAAMVPGSAASSPGTMPGQAFLESFFGSDALTGAVARQASLMAGIAPDTIQKLMPSLAMLTMETMVRSTMANLSRNQPQGLATGDFGGVTAEMMRRGANAVEALSRASDAPAGRNSASAPIPPTYFTDAFADALKTGLAWMQTGPGAPSNASAARRDTAPSPAPSPMLPFAALFDAFAKGMTAAIEEETGAGADEPFPAAPGARTGGDGVGQTAPPPPKPGDSLVGEFLQTGQKFQEDYAKEMALLFERYPGTAKTG